MSSKRLFIIIILLASILRLWQLDRVPVSMFGDELDVGYQAYSVLKTGKDYYGNSWPMHFHSLAEWRTPLYLYSAVPTVALFGISPLGVRLPAAIFGIIGVAVFYYFVRKLSGSERLALIAMALLAVSPWHIQYSRAGFEVTQLLVLLILGLWMFLKGLNEGKYLWVSMVALALTPWVYSTGKFFTPLVIAFLAIVYRKELISLKRKYLYSALLALFIVGAPIVISTVIGGGAERFGYISVFTDPTTETEVGVAREVDARHRGETGAGLSPALQDRVLHNKYVFWSESVIRNYLEAFSTEFLFTRGDPNLRHSIEGMGQFYRIEALVMVLGAIVFFAHEKSIKRKALIAFLLLGGTIPSAITRDGGHHATRLILILIPLVFLTAVGVDRLINIKPKVLKAPVLFIYSGLFVVSFLLYQHNYWVHNPWYSERWWHAGFEEAIDSVKEIDKNFSTVVISTSNEPPWVFFAGWYEYPPRQWQEKFPMDNVVDLPGFGRVSHVGKYYFGTAEGGLYELGKILDEDTLYMATQKEVSVNLIMEPDRTPGDITLLRAVAYPSGEPAFYLFTGVPND